MGANYWKLWWATAVSNVGDGVRLTAFPLLAATLTRDPALVAGTVFASQLPWLLLALPSGAVVDRLDRRTVMWTVDAFRCVAMVLLGLAVLADAHTLAGLYVVAFVLGTAETLFDSASFALLPAIVDETDLERANGPLVMAFSINNELVGPPLGGLLFAGFAALPFFVDAASFGGAAALMLTLTGTYRGQASDGRPGTTLRSDILQGLQFLWRHRLLRGLAAISATANAWQFATFSVLVLFASDVLGLGPVGYGLLLSSEGVGGILGAAAAGRISAWAGRRACLFGGLVVVAVGHLVVGLASGPLIAGLALTVQSFAALAWAVVARSLRQGLIPGSLRGRINSVTNLVAWGAIPVGAALGGVLARSFGLRAPFLLAFGFVAAAAFATLSLTARIQEQEGGSA